MKEDGVIPPSESIWFGTVADPETGRRVPAKVFEEGGAAALVILEPRRKLRAVDHRRPVDARTMDPPIRREIVRRLHAAGAVTFEGDPRK